MNNDEQPRAYRGRFAQKPGTEKKGESIALRLPVSLDAQVRAAAGWQSAVDHPALRDWVEAAIREKAEGTASPAPTSELPGGYSIDQIRAAADRVAMTVRPRDRAPIIKAMNALIGELIANGDE